MLSPVPMQTLQLSWVLQESLYERREYERIKEATDILFCLKTFKNLFKVYLFQQMKKKETLFYV